ncbi:MAG: hypothetical protein ABI310_06830 [Microbacteriaceae bacterium]
MYSFDALDLLAADFDSGRPGVETWLCEREAKARRWFDEEYGITMRGTDWSNLTLTCTVEATVATAAESFTGDSSATSLAEAARGTGTLFDELYEGIRENECTECGQPNDNGEGYA